MATSIQWYQTTRERGWVERAASGEDAPGSLLALTGAGDQTIHGFGGCFNELGWIALQRLDEAARRQVLDLLFAPQADGLRLNFCRMPMGASDYAAKWYSYDETPGDYAMAAFSIDGDREHLLPYMREAYRRNPEIKLFASPWSPPTWMKDPPVYNYGRLIWTEENLAAYALYFARFVEAYAQEGIRVHQIHPQNEPVADQKFPSCLWTGRQYAEFIGKYLGPLFERRGIDAEIFLGTINAPDSGGLPFFRNPEFTPYNTGYNDYAHCVMNDPDAARYVKGVAYQWAGKHAIQQTHESYPELTLIQSENECGDGRNTWEYARYVYGLFRHYLANGANAYCYWNMALEAGGASTWGWNQNSMIVIEPAGGYRLAHEYYVMKHFSALIRPGAVRQALCGHWTGNAVAFRNPDGGVALVIQNPFDGEQAVTFDTGAARRTFALTPDSINTIVVA